MNHPLLALPLVPALATAAPVPKSIKWARPLDRAWEVTEVSGDGVEVVFAPQAWEMAGGALTERPEDAGEKGWWTVTEGRQSGLGRCRRSCR